MKVEYNEESTVKKSLTFEIESEVVEKEIAERSEFYARRVNLPGFRPGKVPKDVIKQRFRGQVLEDVIEKIVNKVVHDELEGRGLRPLATPKVSDLKFEENQAMRFKAEFEVLPIVELPDYKGLPVKSRKPEVAEDAVDKEIDKLREDAARYDPVEGRAAREGDFVVLDVEYKTQDDEPAAARAAGLTPDASAGGSRGVRRSTPLATKKDENVLVEVGSTENHVDLNAALAGMSPGDTKDVDLTYGEDHPSEKMRGQTVHYKVELKAVKTKVVPAADDEFAKDLGEFDSLKELRDKIRTQLVAAEERKIDREAKNALLEALVERAGFEVPEALVERHMMARTENAARGLALQGIDPSKAGVDWTRYRDAQKEESVKAAKADILLDEIARREGIEALDADVDSELARLAERSKRTKEAVRSRMEKDGDLAALRARIREEKTLDLMKANARMDFE